MAGAGTGTTVGQPCVVAYAAVTTTPPAQSSTEGSRLCPRGAGPRALAFGHPAGRPAGDVNN
jgi:hypothetical protein